MKVPDLLDFPPVQQALADPSTRYWLRDLLTSAASRDPVDTLADLDAALGLVRSYWDALVAPPAFSSPQAKTGGR